jgi:hypothetical protein
MSCLFSGNKKRGFNPTEYRSPTEYNNLILTESIPNPDGCSYWQFELLSMQSVKTYIQVSLTGADPGGLDSLLTADMRF